MSAALTESSQVAPWTFACSTKNEFRAVQIRVAVRRVRVLTIPAVLIWLCSRVRSLRSSTENGGCDSSITSDLWITLNDTFIGYVSLPLWRYRRLGYIVECALHGPIEHPRRERKSLAPLRYLGLETTQFAVTSKWQPS